MLQFVPAENGTGNKIALTFLELATLIFLVHTFGISAAVNRIYRKLGGFAPFQLLIVSCMLCWRTLFSVVFNVLTFCLIFVFNYVFGQVVLIIEEVDILVHQDVLFLLLIGIGFFLFFLIKTRYS